MKILIVNTVFYGGGAAKVARDIFEFINFETSHEVFFACGRRAGHDVSNVVSFGWRVEKYFHGFFVRFLGVEGIGSYFTTRKLKNFIRNNHFDIIHLHNLHGYYLDCFSFLDFLNTLDIPIIWTFHDEWILNSLKAYTMGCVHCETGKGLCSNVDSYPITYTGFFMHKMLKQKKKVVESLNRLTPVCPSKSLAEKIEKKYNTMNPVRVVHNGADTSFFSPFGKRVFLRKKHNLPADKRIVFFSAAGFKEKRKGIDYVIKTAEAFSDGDVLFLGAGSGRLPAPGNIRSFGYVSDEETMRELYALSDMYLFPSSAETFGIVIVEAMASGLPVVAFNIGPVREIVTDKEGILVDVGDVRGLKSAVKSILSDDALRKQMGLNARERAEKHFSLEKMLKSYESIYNNAGS